MKHLIIIFIIILMSWSCSKSDKEVEQIQTYQGPLQEAVDIELYYSEATQVKVKLVAKKLLEFESGDREFPEGIYMEFFDEETGDITSTLKANEAYFFKKDNLWRGRGDVIIKDIEKSQQLNTEELFWDQAQEKMYTDKFVTITLDQEVLYGRGFEAKQDFSSYILKNPEGEFYLDE